MTLFVSLMSGSNGPKWHLWWKILGILTPLLWHEYMFQRTFPNITQLYCGPIITLPTSSDFGSEPFLNRAKKPFVPAVTFHSLLWSSFAFDLGSWLSLKKTLPSKSKETVSLVFLRLRGMKPLTGERWHLLLINILFFRLRFNGLITECPEARLSSYLNINKMLVSWDLICQDSTQTADL